MQKKGDFQAAVSLLQRELDQRAVTKETEPVRLQLNFALAYLNEQEASRQPADANSLLRESARRYRTVLGIRQDDEGATRNLALVYRRLGQQDEAAKVLGDAIRRGADRTGALSMQLGDLHAQTANWDRALVSYTAAAEKSQSEAARRRVVQTYQHLSVERSGTLLAVLPAWEFQSPGVAKMGYEAIMRTAGDRPNAAADRSLLLWADLVARKDLLSTQALPRRGDLASNLRDWSRLLQEPSDGELPPSATGADSATRHVLARLALAVGAERLRAGKPNAAAAVWQMGLKVAPGVNDYEGIQSEYPTFVCVRADLLKELAFLYFQYPPSESRGSRIDRLLELRQDLFDMKDYAYRTGNAEAVQRLHMALGLIYEKMGVWNSSPDPENARFQLGRVLETADRRERATRFYQPLPDVSRMLAEGLQKMDSPREAAESYLRAAQGYLDTDQLEEANKMFEALNSLAVRMGDRQTAWMQEMQETLRIRQSIASMGSVSGVLLEEQFDRARSRVNDQILKSPLRSSTTLFAARQRFKIYSDLAGPSRREDASASLTAEYAANAVRQGLDRVTTLVGTADLARLKGILALARKEGSDPPAVDVRRARPDRFDGKVWQLFVPGEYSPMFVLVRNTDVAALDALRP
jgi:tetratricopeptide (TPR) repeat protein